MASPVIKVQRLAARPPDADRLDAIAFTSGNAVRTALLNGIADHWRECLTLCVGDRTEALARRAGFANCVSAGGDSSDLERLGRHWLRPGSAVLHIAGRGLGHAFDQALEGQGHRVERWETYQTCALNRLRTDARWVIGRGRASAALVLSPRSGAAFAKLMTKHGLWRARRSFTVACISRATAKAFLDNGRPNPLWTVCVAQRPDLDSTIDALFWRPSVTRRGFLDRDIVR